MRDHGSRCGRWSCGFAAVEGIVGVADSRQSGGVLESAAEQAAAAAPLSFLDSVARVVIGAAAEQSRSAAEGLRVAMSEEEWLRCVETNPMFAAMEPPTEGQLAAFNLACCRRIRHL